MPADGSLLFRTPPPQPLEGGPRPVRFTRAQFQAMIAAGVIRECDRVELIGGEIVDMPSDGYVHEDGVTLLATALEASAAPDSQVLMRARLDVDGGTETYPDLIVQRRGLLVRERNPKGVQLIVEVAVTSLPFDRDAKGPRYAAAGFQEFWIYEPQAGRIWVHRDPMADGRWGTVFKREAAEGVSALFAPDKTFAIPVISEGAGDA